MTTALINPPGIDWTEDDGLYRRVDQFTKGVDDIMLDPLATHKEPSKTRTLMCWLPENIKELVWEAGKDTKNSYKKVTEFLLSWAKPKTTVYNNFKVLKAWSQGSMNFEQFAATVQKLVNDCNIQNTQISTEMKLQSKPTSTEDTATSQLCTKWPQSPTHKVGRRGRHSQIAWQENIQPKCKTPNSRKGYWGNTGRVCH